MPAWIVDGWAELGVTAVKALLIYTLALFALRFAHRRTLAQWTAIDFVAAVALGAIVGRTAVAGNQSFAVGAVAVVTLLVVQALATAGKNRPWFAKAVDHRVRVLLEHGELRRDQLRACGVTETEVCSQLRQQGVERLEDVRYVLYEPKGELTVVPEAAGEPDSDLVRMGLRMAADYPAEDRR